MGESISRGGILLLVSIILFSVAVASSDLVSFQGKALYQGSLINSGNVTIYLYDAASGGNLIYQETFTNSIADGFFDVTLGSGVTLDLEYAKNYYLDLDINGNNIDFSGNDRKIFMSGVGNVTEIRGVDNVFPSTGNVGIGINDPSSTLHVLASSGTTELIIEAGMGESAVLNFTNPSGLDGYWGLEFDPFSDALYFRNRDISNNYYSPLALHGDSISIGKEVFNLNYILDVNGNSIFEGNINVTGTIYGVGSGLTNVNAETLDGFDSSRMLIQKTDIPDAVDLDTYTTTGLYHQNLNSQATSGTNYPQASAGMLEVVEDGSMVYQKYTLYNTPNNVYVRVKYNSAWSSWVKTWSTGNDGSGSGLDADTIDGHDTSYFMTASTDNWVDNAGDTMTGDLLIDKNAATLELKGGGSPPFIALYNPDQVTKNYTVITNRDGTDLTIERSDTKVGDTNYRVFHIQSGQAYIGTGYSGTSGSKIWHEGNDGSGSGLDADTLDGHDTSYFAVSSSGVVGPASATDNAVVRFDTTTGKLIQNSGVTIDDNGRIGLGTSSPNARIQLGDSTPDSSALIVFAESEAATDTYYPRIHQVSVLTPGTTSDLAIGSGSTSGGVLFYTGNVGSNTGHLGAGTSTIRMKIQGDGDVSIGSGTQDYATGAGELYVQNDLEVDGVIYGAGTGLTGTAAGLTAGAVSANAVALGTDTTGNYVGSITGGTGITVSGTAGEGWTPTVAVTADSIGDTQLLYNTGQHLTTASSPTFSGLSVGIVTDDDGSVPGYGDYLYFRGGDDWPGWNSDNSDPLFIARYNKGSDSTDLRVNIGDGVTASDAFAVGTSANGFNVIYARMDGTVGIGTTTPSSSLEVSGNVELTNLYDNDGTNFFDSSCTYGVASIDSTGALTCAAQQGTGSGSVTSVTAGNGMTQTGTSTINPTLNVVSHAGTAGSIGTINVGADAIGVNLGTTSTTAYRGDYGNTAYTHSQATSNVHGLTFTAEGSGGGLDADTASDLICTDCIGATEISDIYVLNTGDILSGDWRIGNDDYGGHAAGYTNDARLKLDGNTQMALFAYSDVQTGKPVAVFFKGDEAGNVPTVIIAGDADGVSENILDVRGNAAGSSVDLNSSSNSPDTIFEVRGDDNVYVKGSIYADGNYQSGTSNKVATESWVTTQGYSTSSGTVTSVTAGNGMTQTGTSTINPTLNVVSHAGTAGSIGTINVGADAIGVNLGTTNTTAYRGDYGNTAYTHSQATSNVHGLTFTAEGSGGGLDADLLDGYHASSSSTVNTMALRDSNGDVNARLFKSEFDTTNPTINYIMTQIDTVSNNYVRPSTPAQVKASLGYITSDDAPTVTGVWTYNAIPAFNGGTSGSTAPFTVDSTQVVTNLNADTVDGVQGSSFLRSDADDVTSGRIQISGGSNGDAYNLAPLEIIQTYGAALDAPHISFHYSGSVASQIGFLKGDNSGDIAILDNPGTGYETLRVRDLKIGTTSFIDGSRNIVNGVAATFSGAVTASSFTEGGTALSSKYLGISGNAATASALAANGANCAAGQYPLGVSASGAVESCTADDDVPDSDSEVPNAITISGGTIGSNTVSSGAVFTLTNTLNIGSMYIDGTNNKVGIGIASPLFKLHVLVDGNLGGSLGDYKNLTRITATGQSNTFNYNTFIYRNAAGTDWTTVDLMDGISVDSSYITPSTMRTWIRRDPQLGTFYIGDTTNTYLTLTSTSTTVGNGLTVSGAVTASSFSGAGTGLTGTAASLSIGGNAATASALAANGANCAAGQYPLGVSASGAVESCTADDDVPESGDFGAAVDLDATGAVSANAVALGTDTTGNYVASVTAGNGLTSSGTAGEGWTPTLNVVSHAGTAGSIGTINVGADAIGVNLGTTSTTAYRGDYGNTAYTHSQATSGTIHGLTFTAEGSGGGLDADTVDGINSSSFLRSDATDSASGAIDFTNSIGTSYGIDGRYSAVSGNNSFGATIWGLDSSYRGTSSGNTYAPTTLYGLAWIRGSNSNFNADIGEGAYLYQNAVLKGGIGTAGIYTVGTLTGATLNTGQGDYELYAMNQDVQTTSAPTFSEVNTGYVDFTANTVNGIRFWGGASTYSITMGNDQAAQGTVTDYSMHFNMGTTANRGFTFGSSDTAVAASINALTGDISTDGTVSATAFYYTSDRRLKEFINPLNSSLDKILKLDGVSFKWRNSTNNNTQIGLIAQDVERVFPGLVNTDNNTGLKSVEYGNLVAPLIEATKELNNKVESSDESTQKALKDVLALLDSQQKQIDELKAELEALKK